MAFLITPFGAGPRSRSGEVRARRCTTSTSGTGRAPIRGGGFRASSAITARPRCYAAARVGFVRSSRACAFVTSFSSTRCAHLSRQKALTPTTASASPTAGPRATPASGRGSAISNGARGTSGCGRPTERRGPVRGDRATSSGRGGASGASKALAGASPDGLGAVIAGALAASAGPMHPAGVVKTSARSTPASVIAVRSTFMVAATRRGFAGR